MALPPFTSKIIADTGISMGDEGKGRLIHEVIQEISEIEEDPHRVGMVMKVNGGSNSGHTAARLKLNLLPCGVPEPNVELLGIGAGVVADPRKIWWEMRPLEMDNRYEIFSRLLIDERCMVSDLNHRLLDLAAEYYRHQILKEDPRGSTGRGISPAYTDETSQGQIFYQVFQESKDAFVDLLRQRSRRAKAMIQHVFQVPPEAWFSFFTTLTEAETRANESAIQSRIFDRGEFDFHVFSDPDQPYELDFDALVETYWNAGSSLASTIGDIREATFRLLQEDKYIIGEFGQSYWLDKRHGFSPNVTASHTFTSEFFQSASVPVQPIHNIGVCKGYDTKVGTHIFITKMEEDDPLCRRLKSLEFGTSTGRQRMVGWYDAVEKGDAIRYGGCQDIMINKIDVLGADDEWKGKLKICVAYEDSAGNQYYQVPRSDFLRSTLKPVYLELEPWNQDIQSCRSWSELPAQAHYYVLALVKATYDIATRQGNSPIDFPNLRYLGVGPEPDQIIKDIPELEVLLAQAAELPTFHA